MDNHAKRVSYQFRRATVEVIDEQGRTFPLSRTGQKALDDARKGPDPLAMPLPAGKGATTELAFDLPADSRDPCLRLTFGKVGDALDGLLGGRKQFRLDPGADPLAGGG